MSGVQKSGFVRQHMLQQQPPPKGSSGAFRWLKDNLFSSWLNSALTVFGVALVAMIVAVVGPWLLHSVWSSDSLKECRSIVTVAFGDNATGACFAVIKARWHQFLFGLYPQEEYWRPTLAFILLFPAVAPILFSNVPRKFLLVSLVYPFIAVWLLWGGPVAVVLVRLLVLGLTPLVFHAMRRLTSAAAALGIAAMAFIAAEWFAVSSIANLIAPIAEFSLPAVSSDRFGGFMLSVIIGVAAIFGSLPLGVLLALGRISNLPVIKSVCVIFIEIIRGVPLITRNRPVLAALFGR